MAYIYPNLCLELYEAEVSVPCLAEKLHLPVESVKSKLRGESPWLLVEAIKICRFLNTDNIDFLFLQLDNNSQFLESQ